MQPLSIFVSSTCYDLRALREHLRAEIVSLGHDPVLSEFPSFPVSPDLTSVDNCRRVVRERADVFVLIVGGRRGSLDPDTERSVVNVEYREAKYAGTDCIVFVDKQVWDLMPHFKKNPTADFSHAVDYPDVFRFIEEISQQTKWIFQFNRTEDIVATLRTQLSIRFRDLLISAKNSRLVVPPEFLNESEAIKRIVINKDELWEYRLASELLKDRMRRLDDKFDEVRSGVTVRRTKFLAGRDTIDFIQDLLKDLTTIMAASQKILSAQLMPAFGPSGVPGNPVLIKRACDNLYVNFTSLYEWEMDVRFVRPHEVFENILFKMHGWADELLSEFRRLPREIDDLLFRPNLSGQYSINLTIGPPSGLQEFAAELHLLAEDPRVISVLAGHR